MIKCKDYCPHDLFSGCCSECEVMECEDRCTFDPENCGYAIPEGTDMTTVFNQEVEVVMKRIREVVLKKKELEDQEKEMKQQIQNAMEKFEIKKFENDIMSITYVAETIATSVDSAALKKKYPDIADECSKTSKKSAYVKITVK